MPDTYWPQAGAVDDDRANAARAVEARLAEIVERLNRADGIAGELAEARATIGRLTSDTDGRAGPEGPQDDVLYTPVAVQSHERPPIEMRRDHPVANGGPMPRLGELMIARGLLSPEDLDRALQAQRATGRRLGEMLIELGIVNAQAVSRALAEHLGVPFVDLDERQPDVMVRDLLNGDAARRYRAVPVERWSDQLVVALADPRDLFALDDLRVLTGERILAALADGDQIARTIERIYFESTIESSLDDVGEDLTASEIPEEILNIDDGPVVRLANALLEQAVVDQASDLHIEPTTEDIRIRFRVDGILHVTSRAPLSVLKPLVSRLKVIGALDIAQSRTPQDGRFSLTVRGRTIDVRIATVPTAAGEAVVLRMLDPQRGVSDMASLGLSEEENARFLPVFQAPQGAVFVTGPTGSGKSSTLYAMLASINTPDKSIVAVEDPVEYVVNGVKQIQINTRAGMTFPSVLRSILRADPDVILIGEVRDLETARIAADASITGHLVLSTLHATRAAAGPIRLVDMGVEPYLVSSALTCVAAQRLYRKLCDVCAREVADPDLAALRSFGAVDDLLDGGISVRAAVGCPTCLGTGYRGRAALFEIMPVSETIGRLIVERANSADVEHAAIEEGMDTLRRAALKRVLRGELTMEEMVRVVA